MAGCATGGPAPGAAPVHRGGLATRVARAVPGGRPAARSPSVPPRPAPSYGPGHPITGRLAGKLPTFIPHAGHVVALTFDAGANDAGVPSILRTLRRFHVAATFFMTGDFARTYPAVAHEITADGFRIGNHTMTHAYLTHLGDAGVRWEIRAAARAITKAAGQNPAPLFRFPYGDEDAQTIAIANRLGYVTVSWTVDTLGWEGASAGITVSEVTSRVLAALRPGEIVLMHVGSSPDGSTLDAHALPRVIRKLRARGYSFVTLNALLG
jgi:peptidoglycan-N-acetylglucosamine deacetylase